VNGLLFGRTTTTYEAAHEQPHYGAIFHFDPNNPRHDAMTPFNGLLYGTTLDGGTHNTGIIFSIG